MLKAISYVAIALFIFHHWFLKMYRSPKKGGAYRKNLLKNYTNMLLFQGEIEANTCQVTPQPHVEGIMYSYIAK